MGRPLRPAAARRDRARRSAGRRRARRRRRSWRSAFDQHEAAVGDGERRPTFCSTSRMVTPRRIDRLQASKTPPSTSFGDSPAEARRASAPWARRSARGRSPASAAGRPTAAGAAPPAARRDRGTCRRARPMRPARASFGQDSGGELQVVARSTAWRRCSRSAARRRGRAASNAARARAVMSAPSSTTLPANIGTRPATALIRVDLPAPFGPRIDDDLAAHAPTDRAAHDRHARLVAGDEAARPTARAGAPLMPGPRRDRPRSRGVAGDLRRRAFGKMRPAAITTTRRQSRETRSMLCSMMRRRCPRRLISAIRPMIISSRVGLTPAAGSSSRIACGSAIRTRASSSSLRWPPDRTRAGSCASRGQRDEFEQRHGLVDARPLLAPRRGRARAQLGRCARRVWRCAAGQHVLQHRHPGEGPRIWKVRPSAERGCALSGPRLVTSEPPSTMRALRRPQAAGDQVEQRRLAGAVRADQPDDLALRDRERHVVDGAHAAERLDETARFEQRRRRDAEVGCWRRCIRCLTARRIKLYIVSLADSRSERAQRAGTVRLCFMREYTTGSRSGRARRRSMPTRGVPSGCRLRGHRSWMSRRRQLRALRPEGRGGRAGRRADLLRRQARRLFRAAGRDALPAARAGLFHLLACGAAAAARRQAAPDPSERLDGDRRRGRLPRPELPHAAAHHADRQAHVLPRGDHRRAARKAEPCRCSAIRARARATKSPASSAAAGSWPAATARSTARPGRRPDRLRRGRHHHLRLRRHLYRRRGADRRLPAALSPTGTAARRCARIKVHTKFVPDLDVLPTITKAACRARHRPVAEAARSRSGSISCSSTGGTMRCRGWLEAALWLDELRREGKIDLLGGTNFDTRAQQALLARRRAARHHAGAVFAARQPARTRRMASSAAANGVQLLCYGTVAGGFLATRWLGAAGAAGAVREPLAHQIQADHRRFRRLGRCSRICSARLRRIADRHGSGHRHRRERGDADAAGGRRRHRRRAQPLAPRSRTSRISGVALTAPTTPRSIAVLAAARPLEGDVFALERDRERPPRLDHEIQSEQGRRLTMAREARHPDVRRER